MLKSSYRPIGHFMVSLMGDLFRVPVLFRDPVGCISRPRIPRPPKRQVQFYVHCGPQLAETRAQSPKFQPLKPQIPNFLNHHQTTTTTTTTTTNPKLLIEPNKEIGFPCFVTGGVSSAPRGSDL